MFRAGDTIKCIKTRGRKSLTLYRKYEVIKDEEPGVLPHKPYVTILCDKEPLRCSVTYFEEA